MQMSSIHSSGRPDFSKRVLVVEDEPVILDALAFVLTLNQYVVVRARTFAEGRDGLIHQPDFLLTDLTLPDGSGLDLIRCARERNDPVAVGIVIAPSQMPSPEIAQLHPDAVFHKPVDPKNLLTWLLTSTISAPFEPTPRVFRGADSSGAFLHERRIGWRAEF
jgi:CheY-like chemotaxis protein